MRVGRVIGRVVLSRAAPSLVGARWLLVSPQGEEGLRRFGEGVVVMDGGVSLVVYDGLGGGVGDVVGFVEGREAASPFDEPTPVDAICAALVDSVFYFGR